MPANALQRRCGGLFDHLERLTTRNIILSITTLLALMAGCATYFFIIFKSMSGAGRLHWMFREHPWVFASIPGMLCCATVILIPVSVLRHPSSVRIIFFFLVAWIAVLILSTIQLYTIQCTCNFQKSMFFECRVVQEIGLNAPWRDKITVANPFKDLTPFLQNPKGLKSKEKQKIRDRAADMSKLREAEEEEEKQVAASEQIGKEANKTDTTKRGKPILDKEKTEKKPDDENAEKKPDDENAEKKPDDENAEKKPDDENAEENEAALLEVTVPVTARVRDAKPQQTADGAAQVSFLQVEARGLVKSSGNTEKLADIPDTKPPPGKERRMYIQREYQNEIKRVAALEGLSLQQIEKPRTKEDDDDEDDSNDDDDDDDAVSDDVHMVDVENAPAHERNLPPTKLLPAESSVKCLTKHGSDLAPPRRPASGKPPPPRLPVLEKPPESSLTVLQDRTPKQPPPPLPHSLMTEREEVQCDVDGYPGFIHWHGAKRLLHGEPISNILRPRR
eukprot:GEMP01013417.1.p1 GENE.GEMP01013417.1~~GEMP01013417.1.p1  ORF type:complete len:505 (-),score=104.26 GEMP01013417.1:1452-2966(-)